jgi:hypothetical protein
MVDWGQRSHEVLRQVQSLVKTCALYLVLTVGRLMWMEQTTSSKLAESTRQDNEYTPLTTSVLC